MRARERNDCNKVSFSRIYNIYELFPEILIIKYFSCCCCSCLSPRSAYFYEFPPTAGEFNFQKPLQFTNSLSFFLNVTLTPTHTHTHRGTRDKEAHNVGPIAERLKNCQSKGSQQSTKWRTSQGKFLSISPT